MNSPSDFLKAFPYSRETLRKFLRVNEAGHEWKEGDTFDSAYRELTEDQRVGLYVKVSPWLRDALKREARESGRTMGEVLEETLKQIFGEPAS